MEKKCTPGLGAPKAIFGSGPFPDHIQFHKSRTHRVAGELRSDLYGRVHFGLNAVLHQCVTIGGDNRADCTSSDFVSRLIARGGFTWEIPGDVHGRHRQAKAGPAIP